MASYAVYSASLALLAFSTFVSCAPVADSQLQARADPPALRGDESLLGDIGPITQAPAPPVDDYDLAPGQDADPDLGFYFDFTKVNNPQPIRGSKGGTDPGPRMSQPHNVCWEFH